MALSEKTATEVQDLAWAMADDMASPDDIKRLEDLLLADAEARQLYVQCMQLQADLHLFFNPKPSVPANLPTSGKSPVPVLKGLPTIPSQSSTKV